MIEPQQATTPLAPYVIRNFILPLLVYTDKSLINLTRKFKLFELIRYTLVTIILFFLKIIPSFFLSDSNFNPNSNSDNDFYYGSFLDSDTESNGTYLRVPYIKGTQERKEIGEYNLAGDTCIARALAQLLSIINEIPVSSRKYEVVRSYAEKLIDQNLEENHEALRKVNSTVLSHAFSHALRQLEMAAEVAVVVENDDDTMIKSKSKSGGGRFGLTRVIKTVGYYGDVAWTRFRKKKKARFEGSAEKLSAELLWLAEKLAACGSGDEAVREWASASKLASVALSAQLRLQGSLVKLSAFLFKQAVNMGGEDQEEGNMDELRKIKMTLLMSWLPFMCQASLGTDAPVLTIKEKLELENVLGELIGSLKHEEEQEKVLSLWLHHFTHCPSSDWPNLHLYYARWCTASRKLLILEGKSVQANKNNHC